MMTVSTRKFVIMGFDMELFLMLDFCFLFGGNVVALADVFDFLYFFLLLSCFFWIFYQNYL